MYRIIGADGKEYGPISAQQLGQWVAEGRADAATRAVVDGFTEWKPLGYFPEFSPWFAQATPTPPSPAPPAPASLAPARRTNASATTSLVLAILSFTLGFCCCYGMPFSVLGIIFSLIALSQINRNPQLYDGKGLAIAGLIVSVFNLVLAVTLLLVVGAVRSWPAAGHHFHRL